VIEVDQGVVDDVSVVESDEVEVPDGPVVVPGVVVVPDGLVPVLGVVAVPDGSVLVPGVVVVPVGVVPVGVVPVGVVEVPVGVVVVVLGGVVVDVGVVVVPDGSVLVPGVVVVPVGVVESVGAPLEVVSVVEVEVVVLAAAVELSPAPDCVCSGVTDPPALEFVVGVTATVVVWALDAGAAGVGAAGRTVATVVVPVRPRAGVAWAEAVGEDAAGVTARVTLAWAAAGLTAATVSTSMGLIAAGVTFGELFARW